MNTNEIKIKCAELLKKTSLYSDEYLPKLNSAFEHNTTDMHLNYEFFGDGARVFCYERGKLVGEWRADETQAVYLIVKDVLYRVASEIVMRKENLIKRANGKYIDTELQESLMNKAFEEIGGVYLELRKRDFGAFDLDKWS
ncbi:MAG: hypothetical protein NC299_06570 [Lachnospiraceae bacterium]|nr:hypothetical protein [Ruminococcus sp.]MCM1275018.1 hypothetical protein [Lachnospiraceae bacterium]